MQVFCGRDPERGVETCTVVEMLASYEQGFASLGMPALADRIERIAFNALPAALTADMWTHVYVHQANSVYAGVTHPQSTRGHEHTHAHAAADASARTCPRGACHGGPTEASRSPPPLQSLLPAAAPPPPASPVPPSLGGGPAAFSEIQKANYFGTSHFPCCITNFPQGWPKLVQSAVMVEPTVEPAATPPAVVVAMLIPVRATVAAANASIHVQSDYPFADGGTITVTAGQPITLKVRIPAWATRATLNGTGVANGTLAAVLCPAGDTVVVVHFAPELRVERGWGDALASPAADAVAITRGPLVFALHPEEQRQAIRTFHTVPPAVGEHAPDYLIRTNEAWNYALDFDAAAPAFISQPSTGWQISFPFDDSGTYPFAVHVMGRRVPSWGYWRGSNITNPPPVSPVDCTHCGPLTKLQLVPFGSTNIRIAVFPHTGGLQ